MFQAEIHILDCILFFSALDVFKKMSKRSLEGQDEIVMQEQGDASFKIQMGPEIVYQTEWWKTPHARSKNWENTSIFNHNMHNFFFDSLDQIWLCSFLTACAALSIKVQASNKAIIFLSTLVLD